MTLVELAIVMVAVGLLIGGVLKGLQLMENARINSTIKEVQSIRAAVHTFQDKYLALPGDFFEATTALPNCTAANFCLNGDENGWVGMGTYPGLSTVVSSQPETVQFWKHLAAVDLVTGIDTSVDWRNPELGKTHPRGAIGGGYEFFYDPSLYGGRPTHVLRLNNQIVTSSSNREDIGVVSPHVGMQIDRKMDDGNPRTGNVIVWDHAAVGCDPVEGSTENRDEIGCTLMFAVD